MRAPTATISGGRWFVGSLEQTLPPIVPRFRTWTSAICAQTSPRMGLAFASAEAISSEYVVIAPIVSVPSAASSIPRSSSRPLMSTSLSGEAARAFITLISVWPPASARPQSFAARSASATDPGFAYSTSRSSIVAILSRSGHRLRVDAGARRSQRPAGTAGPHREDLGKDGDGGLLGRARAEVEPGGAGDARQVLFRHAFFEEQPAPPFLVPARAEPAEVERLGRKCAAYEGEVELVVVRQDDDRGRGIGGDLRQRLVRPEHEELVCARDPLGRGEARPGVGHDRPPAEQLDRGAERFCSVGGTVDEEPGRRNAHVGEDRPAFVLEDVAPAAAARRLLEVRVMELLSDLVARDDGEHDVPVVVSIWLDEHVDLAAARQPDAEGHLVGDPVRDQARLAAGENLLCGQDDVVLDAAVRDRALDAAVVADDELRPYRPRGGAPGCNHRRDGG